MERERIKALRSILAHPNAVREKATDLLFTSKLNIRIGAGEPFPQGWGRTHAGATVSGVVIIVVAQMKTRDNTARHVNISIQFQIIQLD